MLLPASSREILHGHNLYLLSTQYWLNLNSGPQFFKLSLQSIDCVSESLFKSIEGGPSYGNYQPTV